MRKQTLISHSVQIQQYLNISLKTFVLLLDNLTYFILYNKVFRHAALLRKSQ